MTADIVADYDEAEPKVWQFKLYVADNSPNSARALVNLTKLCEDHLHGRYEIEVVDLVLDPTMALNDDILAVPTLVRLLPTPFRRVIGDLSNADSVILGLRLGVE